MNNLEDMDQSKVEDIIHTVLKLLGSWDIDAKNQIIILGLPDGTKPRSLKRYLQGTPLPNRVDFLQRAHALLTIQNAIMHIFPHSGVAANYWITTQSAFIDYKTPLQVILEEGLVGMQRIVDHLENNSQY